MFLTTVLSLDETSTSGTRLMLVDEEFEDEDEFEDVLPEEEELSIGGDFAGFPFAIFGFDEEVATSFSCVDDVKEGVLRAIFGEV